MSLPDRRRDVRWNPEVTPGRLEWRNGAGVWVPVRVSATVAVFGAAGAGHSSGAVPDPGAVAGLNRFLRDDATWAVPGGASVSSVSIAFAGDTYVRQTVVDAAATATSKVLLSITTPTTTELDDTGWVFHSQVVTRAVGSFDVVCWATNIFDVDDDGTGPTGSVQLCYLLG